MIGLRFLVSGGQSGVDRGVLRFAAEAGLAYRGWTPAGGWAEDLPDPPGVLALYPGLRPTETADPRHRTSLNVEESDAVLIIGDPAISPGTAWARTCAQRFEKPHRVISADAAAASVRGWLHEIPDLVALNVAGPRASEWPGADQRAFSLLGRIFGPHISV